MLSTNYQRSFPQQSQTNSRLAALRSNLELRNLLNEGNLELLRVQFSTGGSTELDLSDSESSLSETGLRTLERLLRDPQVRLESLVLGKVPSVTPILQCLAHSGLKSLDLSKMSIVKPDKSWSLQPVHLGMLASFLNVLHSGSAFRQLRINLTELTQELERLSALIKTGLASPSEQYIFKIGSEAIHTFNSVASQARNNGVEVLVDLQQQTNAPVMPTTAPQTSVSAPQSVSNADYAVDLLNHGHYQQTEAELRAFHGRGAELDLAGQQLILDHTGCNALQTLLLKELPLHGLKLGRVSWTGFPSLLNTALTQSQLTELHLGQLVIVELTSRGKVVEEPFQSALLKMLQTWVLQLPPSGTRLRRIEIDARHYEDANAQVIRDLRAMKKIAAKKGVSIELLGLYKAQMNDVNWRENPNWEWGWEVSRNIAELIKAGGDELAVRRALENLPSPVQELELPSNTPSDMQLVRSFMRYPPSGMKRLIVNGHIATFEPILQALPGAGLAELDLGRAFVSIYFRDSRETSHNPIPTIEGRDARDAWQSPLSMDLVERLEDIFSHSNEQQEWTTRVIVCPTHAECFETINELRTKTHAIVRPTAYMQLGLMSESLDTMSLRLRTLRSQGAPIDIF